MCNTRLHNCWAGMLQRCKNPNDKLYHRYGGRGIAVCSEWESFENFHAWATSNGYSSELTIDRIDNDGGYYPENCRWVDRMTQNNNTSQNHRVSYHGLNKTIAEWSRMVGMDYDRLYRHLIKNDMSDLEKYFEKEETK